MFCAIIGAKDISDISVAIITLIIIAIFIFNTKQIICPIKKDKNISLGIYKQHTPKLMFSYR